MKTSVIIGVVGHNHYLKASLFADSSENEDVHLPRLLLKHAHSIVWSGAS